MTVIHMVRIPDILDARRLAALSARLSPAKRARLLRFRQPADAYRTLYADLLVRRSLLRTFGLRSEEIRFEDGPFGKPFVPDLPTFEFSLSHAGDWAVCAVDDRPIGVDIERMDPIEFEIARTFFSREEYGELMRTASEDRLNRFYELWTIKESFIKMTGKGLQTPLDSFSVRKRGETFELHQADGVLPCRVASYSVGDAYKLAACGLGGTLPPKPVALDRNELEHDFL